MDNVKTFRRGSTNWNAPSFNNLGLTRSGPGAFDGLRSLMAAMMSSLVITSVLSG